jgi:phage-related holin
MADKTGLGFLGFLFGGITFAVTIIAFLVVRDHVEGRLQLDEMAMAPQLASMTSQ